MEEWGGGARPASWAASSLLPVGPMAGDGPRAPPVPGLLGQQGGPGQEWTATVPLSTPCAGVGRQSRQPLLETRVWGAWGSPEGLKSDQKGAMG